MFMRDLVGTLRRRWQFAVAGILATVGLCVAAFVLVPATYQAKANIVLLPPKSTVGIGGNPYLQLGGLDQVVDVLARALNSQQAVDSVAAGAPGATYEVAQDFATSGPILVVTAGNRTSTSTLQALNVVVAMVQPSLTNLQESLGVAAGAQITASVITSDDRPETVRKTQIRALVVAAAIGVVLSAAVIALVDSWLMRRRRRAERPSGPASTADQGARHAAEPVEPVVPPQPSAEPAHPESSARRTRSAERAAGELAEVRLDEPSGSRRRR